MGLIILAPSADDWLDKSSMKGMLFAGEHPGRRDRMSA